MIQNLKADYEEKQVRFADNSAMRDRFCPLILQTVEELKEENKQLLESNVRFSQTINYITKQTRFHLVHKIWILKCYLRFVTGVII